MDEKRAKFAKRVTREEKEGVREGFIRIEARREFRRAERAGDLERPRSVLDGRKDSFAGRREEKNVWVEKKMELSNL